MRDMFSCCSAFPVRDGATGPDRPALCSDIQFTTDGGSLSRELPPEAFLTTGIVLAFHDWPDEEEKAGILRDAEQAGLQKTEEELEYTKVWFLRGRIKSHKIA